MSDQILDEVRASMFIQMYVTKPETDLGVPTLRYRGQGQSDVVTCPCGDEHEVTETSFGLRALCDDLQVRWVHLAEDVVRVGRTSIRGWTPEPYATMSVRNTREG